jgi:phage tail-like protein
VLDQSIRGTIPDLPTRRPLGAAMPGLFLERELDPRTGFLRDSFAERFAAALDTVLAPVFATLDNLPAYFDPEVAPADFLDWLAGWVGIEPTETWPESLRRQLVAGATQLYALRGTAQGIAKLVEIFTGLTPEIEENGGVNWSVTPGSPLPGSAGAWVTVRVTVDATHPVDEQVVRRLVAAVKPAHVIAKVEVVAA